MAFSIEPLKHDDLDTFIKVWWESFAPIEINQVLPQIYPNGLTPALQDRLKKRVMIETDGDTVEYCLVAREDATKEIVGICWWKPMSKPAPLISDAEAKAELEDSLKNKNAGSAIDGMNSKLGDAFYTALYEKERQHIKAKKVPYMTLNVLAVLPDYNRRGIGSQLLEAGLARVDSLNVWTFLVGSMTGRGLYLKHGFEVVDDLGIDATKYGGRSPAEHYIMIRPPAKA